MPLVGNGVQTVGNQAVKAEMRHEAHPEGGHMRLGVGGHQPAIQRRDNVGVLVREENFAQLRPPQHGEGFGQHLAVDLVAAGIEDHSGCRRG